MDKAADAVSAYTQAKIEDVHKLLKKIPKSDAGHLEDSKSNTGRTLCVFASHTFDSISWM